ncbi:hypothetical protein CK203_013933 [Vitis vinifera]|uniref:Uncharacterized protein n=1 Tax=Vitis vinifera TaxID=29760 RepID=A0A438JJB4_VITVI|nr:hypothetical protein CK203_013933 [Vitis vinifera]
MLDDVWQELVVADTDTSRVTAEWAMGESMKKIPEELTTEINQNTLIPTFRSYHTFKLASRKP